jgi:hypothetical protein
MLSPITKLSVLTEPPVKTEPPSEAVTHVHVHAGAAAKEQQTKPIEVDLKSSVRPDSHTSAYMTT